MIVRKQYTITYAQDGQRIRDNIDGWYLLGVIPLIIRRSELWRRADAVDDELRKKVLQKDDYQCVYCGSTRYDTLAIDHRIPQSQGGVSVFENLLTACKSCNSRKSDKTPEEAGMPIVYGRFRKSIVVPNVATLEDEGDALPPETDTIAQLFIDGHSVAAITNEVYGQSSQAGARYQKRSADVQRAIRAVFRQASRQASGGVS